MAGQYRFKDQSGNIVAQISASVGGAIAFSGSVVDFTQANNVILGNVQLAGTASNALLLDGFDSQAFAFTSSIHPFTASTNSRLNSIETISASNISRLNSLEEKTGSLATTGSNTFNGNQTISGTVYIQNDLVVQGCSSLQNITASAVSIGTNIVSLNTATPSVRYAGLTVQDSGSSAGVTGSILWDSLCNRWMYSNPSTVGYSGGIIMSGPRAATLGTETTLTCNYVAKSGGGDHLYDSCIVDDGTTTCIKNNLVAGIGNFSTCLTFGDWTTATNVLSSNKPNEQGAYIRAAVSTAANPTYTFEDDRDTGMYRDSANSLGFATSGSFRMVINNTGLVGIGASPLSATAANLQIEQAQSNILAIRRADCSNTGNSRILFQAYNASGVMQNTGIVEAGLDNSTTNGYLGFYAGTSAMNMKITSNGRVGIGTTPDYGTLSIFCTDNTIISSTEWGTSAACNLVMAVYNGSQCVGSAAGIRFITRNSGASIWNIYNISTGASTGDLAFGNGTGGSGTEKMRITNTGLVGIGTIEPQARLHLCTINTSAIVRVESACDQAGIRLIAGVPGTGRATRIDFLNGATCVGRPQWSIINDYSQNGTNELNFINCDPATKVLQIFQSGVACFSNTISAPYYAGGTSYTIDFLVVAGGGGGGGSEMSNGYGGGGGAGGAGGYLASSISVNCGSSYPIVVGTGGAGGPSCLAPNGSGVPGSPGTFSSAFGFIAIGGGGGAGDEGGSTFNATACQTGGSGGGQGGDGGGTRGIAVIGQGSNGGPNVSRSGGGGGGAVGTPGGSTGGAGRQWLDTNYYAGGGGGGGGGNDQTQYLGGVGGGGNGSRSYPGGGTSGEAGGQATAGQACTGGGGGGAGSGYLQGGMAGGSGIVIIRYFGSQRGSGGTVSSSGGYTYHRFGAAGTYTA